MKKGLIIGAAMPSFCPNCGTEITTDTNFCPNCGQKLSATQHKHKEDKHDQLDVEKDITNWTTWKYGLEGKKQSLFAGIDLHVPIKEYRLTNQRLLIVDQGYIGSKRDEIELVNIKDISAQQSFKEKVFDIGDITIYSADESTPEMVMQHIKEPYKIKDAIRLAARQAKSDMKIRYHQDI